MSVVPDPRFEPPAIENPQAYEPFDPESVDWREVEQTAEEMEGPEPDPLDQELMFTRTDLRSTLFGLEPEEVEQPGVCGEWSIRQAIAHIAGWDEYIYGMLDRLMWDDEPLLLWPFDIDEFNNYHVAKREDMSWEELQQAFRLSGWALQGRLVPFEPEDWEWVIGRTTEGEPVTTRDLTRRLIDHDREHAEQIRAWRASIGKPARTAGEPPSLEEIISNLETSANATVWAIAQAQGEAPSEAENRLLQQAQEWREEIMAMLVDIDESD